MKSKKIFISGISFGQLYYKFKMMIKSDVISWIRIFKCLGQLFEIRICFCYQHSGSWVPQQRNQKEVLEKFPNRFIKIILKYKGGSTEERKALNWLVPCGCFYKLGTKQAFMKRQACGIFHVRVGEASSWKIKFCHYFWAGSGGVVTFLWLAYLCFFWLSGILGIPGVGLCCLTSMIVNKKPNF